MRNAERFDICIGSLGREIREILARLPKTVKENTQEIRLREGLPIALTVAGDVAYPRTDGQVSFYINEALPKTDGKQLEETFRLLCEGSVYAHTEELKNGFIAMKNGCRAGVCGTLNENGFMRDITSVNIRIAHQVWGAANDIVANYSGGGLLIAGPPGSGKTTVLRDLIRQISSGVWGQYRRVAVIDSRCELSGAKGSTLANELGANTDVLITADKAAGIEIALRTMFPEIIAFDEIGNSRELEGVRQSFNSGVEIITTAHIGCVEDLLVRPVTRELIGSGAVKTVAILPNLVGGEIRLINAQEVGAAVV